MARILIIDDSASVLQFIEMALVDAGYETVTCLSAIEAAKVMAALRFDLIVTDILMPEKDGLEIIATGKKVCPTVPIVAITGGKNTQDFRQVARHMGATETLRKPFSREELLDLVTKLLAPVKATR